MCQVVLIKADDKSRLPSAEELRAAGFSLSSALRSAPVADTQGPVRESGGGNGGGKPSPSGKTPD